jgi:riboflavin synthase alpha subunit
VYTGIVTHRGRLERVDAHGGASGVVTLHLRPDRPIEPLAIGDSVAIDGVCLTVTRMDEGRLAFDAVPETLRRTTLGDLAVGAEVNLEAPLRMGDALGGHLVQGHVDGTGTIAAVERRGEDVRIAVEVDATLHGGVLPKGSVTLDGVSLTVGEVWTEGAGDAVHHRFSVYLIPHTLAVTGFGARRVGDRINVELDVLGRWVEHHLRRREAGPATP